MLVGPSVPSRCGAALAGHLRNASRFFPKLNFQHALYAIPESSTVIVGFGEIDCREGLLLAVERDRYASAAEGAAAVVQLYLRVLEEAARLRHLVILVHPIVPVLEPTR